MAAGCRPGVTLRREVLGRERRVSGEGQLAVREGLLQREVGMEQPARGSGHGPELPELIGFG